MELQMVVVRDRSAEVHFPPFFVRSVVDAHRAFGQIMNQKERAGSPSEYDLVHLGTFDDQSAGVVLRDIPVVLANGREVVQQE